MSSANVIPEFGYLRLPQVLALYPVSRSTFWQMVADGRAPKPVRLSARCIAWRIEDIRALCESAGEPQA